MFNQSGKSKHRIKISGEIKSASFADLFFWVEGHKGAAFWRSFLLAVVTSESPGTLLG